MKLLRSGVLATLVILAACARQNSGDEPATEANLSYQVNNQADANRAAMEAQYWCSTRYGFRARRLATRPTATGAVVRYVCSPR